MEQLDVEQSQVKQRQSGSESSTVRAMALFSNPVRCPYFSMALPRLTLPPLYLTMLHIAVAEHHKTKLCRCLEIHYDTLPLRNLTNLCHRMTMSYHTLPCLRIVLLRLAPFRFAIATRCSELFCYATAKLLSGKPLRYQTSQDYA